MIIIELEHAYLIQHWHGIWSIGMAEKLNRIILSVAFQQYTALTAITESITIDNHSD